MAYVEQGKDKYIKLSQALEVLDRCACWWAHEMMERIPAADVREVVLCRDCRYAPTGTDNGEDQGFGLEWPDKETYKCPYFCDDGWYSRKPKPDFFCANGEKKTADMRGEDDV